MATTISQLCKDLPKEFAEYLEYKRINISYLKALNFESQPDYDLLKKLMRKCGENNKVVYDN